MHLTLPRTAGLVLSVIMLISAASVSQAGEVSRPVPSDAQVTRFTRFNLRYSLRDIIADGVQKVEFYITEDMGRTWRLYGEDADRQSPMTIQVPGEGVYGFVCIATDRFDNREREPGPRSRPETVVVVDRTPPTAKWLAPVQDSLGKGQPIDFSWESQDAYFGPAPVRIQFAHNARSNHDREANWQNLQDRLPASGVYQWTPPADAAGTFNFRLIAEDRAGNMAVAYNAATVRVDTQPPVINGVSPLQSNRLRVDVQVEADDGANGSGVKEISLYTTQNQGSTWNLVKEQNERGESVPVRRRPNETILFEAPAAGTFGLWPVAFDEAGNGSALPPVGSIGPYQLVIDNEPPVVSLSDSFLMGRSAVLATDQRTVSWTAYDPHLRENSASIRLSLDNGNTWQDLRSFLPTSGSETINFPFGSQSEEAKLKVTVEDEFGNVGEAESQTFKLSAAETYIDSVTPVTPGSGDSAGTVPQLPSYTAPAIPDPYGGATATPVDPYGAAPDPYGGLSAPPTMDPYGGLAAPPPTDPFGGTAGPGRGESTAGSLPRAMLGDVQTPQSPSTAVPVPPQTEAPVSSLTPSLEWNPSPQAAQTGSGVTPPALPPLGTEAPAWQTPPEPPSGDLAWNFPGGGDTATPPAPAATQGSTQTPPSPFGSDTFGDGLQAPALPPMGEAPSLSLPPLASPDEGLDLPPLSGTPFEGFGDPITPPPLSGPPSLPALGEPSTPVAPGLPVPATPAEAPASTPPAPSPTLADILTGAAPTAPSAPALPTPPGGSQVTPQTGLRPPSGATPSAPVIPMDTPAELPQIPPMDDPIAAPPPIGPAESRPVNKRQLSDHYASEAQTFIIDGRIDQAMQSGTRALNEDDTNPRAYIALSQAYVQQDPPNFGRAAILAKEATNLSREWESWWNCADIYYRWAHARNRTVQAQTRVGQRPAADLVDERNQALSNAQIAIGNSAMLAAQEAGPVERKQVAITQGEITYLRALTIPEPVRPTIDTGPAADEYRRAFAAYKASVTPVLLEALPFFQNAMQLDGTPSYRETFHLGIINFRLGGLERETGNSAQAATYYQDAARYLEEATTAKAVPAEGPREAYYMLAYCHDQLAEVPGGNRARHQELALRYWRQTAEFYPPGTSYREYAEQRLNVLSQELGQ